MGNYGIKASKEGVDVKSATLDDLIFTSKYKSWKVKAEATGTVTITTGNTVGYTETAHSLGYRPFVIGFAEPDTGSGRRLLLCGRTPATGGPRKYLHTDATNFTVIYEKVPAVGSNETYNFYYYVMIDENAT